VGPISSRFSSQLTGSILKATAAGPTCTAPRQGQSGSRRRSTGVKVEESPGAVATVNIGKELKE